MADEDDTKDPGTPGTATDPGPAADYKFPEPVNTGRFQKLELEEDVPATASKPAVDPSSGVPQEQVLEDKVKREQLPERPLPPVRGRQGQPQQELSLEGAGGHHLGNHSTEELMRDIRTPLPPPRDLGAIEELRRRSAPFAGRREGSDDIDRFIEDVNRETDNPTQRPEQEPVRRLTYSARSFLIALGLGVASVVGIIYYSKSNPPTTITSPSQISDDSLVDILDNLSEKVEDGKGFLKDLTTNYFKRKPELAYRTRTVLYDFFTIHSLPSTAKSIDTFMERYHFIGPSSYFLFFDQPDPQGAPFQEGFYSYVKYVGRGKAGPVSIIKSSYLLPNFPSHNYESFPFLDRNAAKALAEKKGKFITGTQFAALERSEPNPYWHLQALERSGPLESLIALPELANPAKAWELQKQRCAVPGQEMYALCSGKYSSEQKLYTLPDAPMPAVAEQCLLFSAEQGKRLLRYLQKEKPHYQRLKNIPDLDGRYISRSDLEKLNPDSDGCLEDLDKVK
ncbi:MAG: hypothetical protein AABX13_04195 [Nanoarchaeota archaeon]